MLNSFQLDSIQMSEAHLLIFQQKIKVKSQIKLSWSKELVEFLASQAEPLLSDLGVKRIVQQEVENPLVEDILGKKMQKGNFVNISLKDKKIVIEVRS